MYSLTTPQQNIWNLQKYYERTSISNICGAVFYNRSMDNAVLEKAINKVIEIYGGLRLQFTEADGKAVQYTSEYEFRSIPAFSFDNMQSFDNFAQKQALEPMELIDSPMYRFTIFNLNDKTGVLLCANHLVSDAWTFSLLAREVVAQYDNLTDSEEISYEEYIEAEQKYFESARYEKDKLYWFEKYSDKPEPCPIKMITVPVSVPTAARYTHIISAEETAEINRFCDENSVSQAVLFEAAVMLYLSRINNENKTVTLGIPVLNRTNVREKSTVGMFISTTPLTVAVSKEDTVALLCDKITATHKELFRHQKFPYSHILQNIREKHDFTGNLYDVMVSFQNAKTDTSASTKWYSNGYSEVPFSLHIDNRDSADSYTMTIDYQTEVFKQSGEINLLAERILHIINQIMENNGKAVSEISIIPDAEYDLMINKFNDTAMEYPKEKCVHELFMEQAAKSPDKIALVFEDKQFTYKQLDEMSNSLAHYLRDKGIDKGDVIGVLLDRSEKVIISQLATLKLGCAFLPIDSRYPSNRVQTLLEGCKVTALLVDNNVKYNEYNILQLCVEDGLSENTDKYVCTYDFDDVCYIIYTSGSTGKPKGCSLTYRGITNFCLNNNLIPYCRNLENQIVVSVNTISFDYFIAETLLPLSNGYTVVLANEQQSDFKQNFKELVTSNDVNIVMTTPTRLKIYTENEDAESYFNNIDIIVSSGEALSKELFAHIKFISNACIFNPLGPSECSVWNVDGDFDDNIDIFNFINNNSINSIHYLNVHELFMEQAAKTPDKIALVFEDKQFTYKQLDEMSNSLAHYLREKGVMPNDVVPIIAKRSWHIIVAMLGILKAGGAFFLLDYKYPTERINYLTKEVKAKIVLSYECIVDGAINICDIDLGNTSPFVNVNKENDLTCVIHTSGSTGKPKAASLTHNNLYNYIGYAEKFFTGTTQVIASTTVTFDAFVLETIVALCNNVTVVLLNENQITKQSEFEHITEEYDDSFMFHTPTKLLSYIRNSNNGTFLKHVKSFVLGGEVFSNELYLSLKSYNNDCDIYNIYGPTETTICATVDDVENIDITIGKPIANTQIYILDQNKKPLPIGVAGELCISGDGVGKGYLNRPELTAEKFIPNPFLEGKTMYCTGDLARWRDDGEIEYLGRIDTQVKIRGLRIELGEIESVMSSFEGIHMTAVTDKRDENNRQYLVGYYTSDTEIDEKALRQHLAAKLPKYMVPNYFVRLEEMPMTASGKTDRKNLPLPDFTLSQEEYIAPKTERENQLCSVLCELFSMEQIGVTDDFFDIGGDSLKAIEYVAKAHTAGVEFALQNVFDYPTVRELCNFLENGAEKAVRYTAADFEKYEEILSRNVIDESFVPEKKSLGNVLLTGATGFLGAHILDNFMQNETGKIYCLVRGNEERFKDVLNYYFGKKYDGEIGNRIIFVAGDITNLTLSADIPDDVQTVIHTAATVKHYGSYEYFRGINVEGTRNVVNYAKRVGAKMIHISTLSVSGNSLADEFSVYRSEEEKNFYEYSLFIGQPLENVYVRSKFEAELEVLDAMLEGLDTKIVRVGNLTNRLSDSKFQPNYESNAFLTRFKAAVELGMFPDYLLPLYAEFSPIDQTAEGVVMIAQYADKQCVFHLNSNRPIYFDRLLEVFKQLNVKMELVSGEMFNNVLQKIAKDSKKEYIYEAFQNDMDENGQLVYDSNIRLKNDFTDWFMRKLSFEWAKIDFEYIRGYVEYFRAIGYLEV